MKPLKDYSFLRGACYTWTGDEARLEPEMGYARRLNLNGIRFWISYEDYERDPSAFLARLKTLVRTAHGFGISSMPILFNGNMLDPATLEGDFLPRGEAYVKAVVDAVAREEGLLMWDIMNEPSFNDYLRFATPEEKPERERKVWAFVRHFCQFVKRIDPENAITVGNTFAEDTPPTADLVDVLSFHDYRETRARVEDAYAEAQAYAAQYDKPLINSELACICRANPYDMALEICQRRGIGWYLFELMISEYWGDVHGIFYPDGTVRDPSIVAAVYGFFRNRDARTRVSPNPGKEGHAQIALKRVEDALKQDTTPFLNKKGSADDLLEAAEYCANLLEAAEMVPMFDPPSVRILAWRAQKEEERDIEAIRDFTYSLALTLKARCRIL